LVEQIKLEIKEPLEEDSIDCHLQQLGMGSLLCRGAQQRGNDNFTNETNPAICFSCNIGKIYRDIGCDAASSDVGIRYFGNSVAYVTLDGIFCKIRRRYTTLEYCHTCTLVTAESTRQIVSDARGLFQNLNFYPAFQDLEKARLAIRDGDFDRSITHSIACLESTCRLIHDELGQKLPDDKNVTSLWKSTRRILELDSLDGENIVAPLLNSLSGVVSQIGAMRNSLSDAHGKGKYSPEVSESFSELALNTAATVATFAIRHFKKKSIALGGENKHE